MWNALHANSIRPIQQRHEKSRESHLAASAAIGTEYARLGLLDEATTTHARAALDDYLTQRIQFHEFHDGAQLARIESKKAVLQSERWRTVEAPAKERRDAVLSLTASGMNDVLNSEGYTQAAWWHRIPTPARFLMMLIAFISQLLVGFGGSRLKAEPELLFILPVSVSISFMLIADIDGPRGGVIRVLPYNLIAVQASLQPH